MNFTASDRKALIRLASTLPKGSEERKTILAGLKARVGTDKTALKKGQKVSVPSGVTDFQGKKVPPGSYTITNVNTPGEGATVALRLPGTATTFAVPREQVEKLRTAKEIKRIGYRWA